MNQNLLMSFSPFTHLFTIIFLLLASKTACVDVDPQFLSCSVTRTCGDGQIISFPFFIQDQQESFCGYPGFNLSCLNSRPVLRLLDDNYIIHQIDYINQTLRLSNAAFLNTSNACVPHLLKNTSLPNDGRFNLLSNQTELLLFSRCNSTLFGGSNSELLKYKINCSGETETETGPILSIFDGDPLLGSASEVCEEELTVPVDVQRGENEGIERMLERGFVLNWTASNCRICETSGGKCGFDDSAYHFRCFCGDRPHASSCPDLPTADAAKGWGMRLGLALGGATLALVMIAVCCCIRKLKPDNSIFFWKKKTGDSKSIDAFLKNHGHMPLKIYRYTEVKKMTENFKDKLGQGGYGGVFKGKLPDGLLVAVKVLKESKSNGEEFVNEVASISRTSHVNIVNLLGFCYEGAKRALIYEFMSNGSLEKYIYEGNPSTANCKLGLETLHDIAIGIARGLEYLHRGCNTRILHFDIKPHNILLDENFCPKISDFGLAKICPGRESIISMMGTRGTAGYIAPEVFCRNFGGVSYKSDVYSYGMLVLEMVGGRKNICSVEDDNSSEIYFPDGIYKSLEQGEKLGFLGIDDEDENQIARKMILVGLWCIQTNPLNRPSMCRVVEMLQGSITSLQMPPRPTLVSPLRSFPQTLINSSATATTGITM